MNSNKFKVCPEPGKYISGVLPVGRIEEPTVISLNEREYLRCRSMANIFAIVGNPPREVSTNGLSYEEAMSLFETDQSVTSTDNTVLTAEEVSESVEEQKTETRVSVNSEVKETVTEEIEVSTEPEQEVSEQESVDEDKEMSESTDESEVDKEETPVKNNGFSNTTEHVSNDRGSDRVSSTKQNAYKGYNNQRNKNKK